MFCKPGSTFVTQETCAEASDYIKDNTARK